MLVYCTTQFAKRQLFCSKKMKQKSNNLLFEAKRTTKKNFVVLLLLIVSYYKNRYSFTIKFLPVISAGISKPMDASIVGAISHKAPCFNVVLSREFTSTMINGTLLVV